MAHDNPGYGAGEKTSAMTWLQAAERILLEEGPEMHIRDLTRRIMELGMVNSSCTTSLETLLYRQTSKGDSKFVRVPGKMGCFGLKDVLTDLEKRPKVVLPSLSEKTLVAGVVMHPPATKISAPGGGRETEERKRVSPDFEPQVFYKRKRKFSCSSDSSGSLSESEASTSADETSESLYRKKYNFVKRLAKSMVYKNEALATHLSTIESKVLKAEQERRYLFEKLLYYEKEGSTANKRLKMSLAQMSSRSAKSHPAIIVDQPKPNPQLVTSLLTRPGAPASTIPSPAHVSNQSSKPKGRANIPARSPSSKTFEGGRQNLKLPDSAAGRDPSPVSSHVSESEDDFALTPTAVHRKSGKKTSQQENRRTAREEGTVGKNKRGKVRRLHPVALNEDGSPQFPIQIGGLSVYNLGEIVWDRQAFHTERYLIPVGFESSRSYPSMKDPSRKCTYTCRILDGGEAPLFEVTAEDDVENPVHASSSTACQTFILRAINKARDNRQATNSGSGPEFFGYSNSTILNLLQKLPDADRCTRYKPIDFDEPSTLKSTKSRPSAGGRETGTKSKSSAKRSSRPAKKSVIKDLYPSDTTPSVVLPPLKLTLPKESVSLGAPLGDSRRDGLTPDPSLAPVVGAQQMGLDLDYSSDDWSSGDDTTETL